MFILLQSAPADLIETEKYFLFDVGIVRALAGMRLVQSGTEEFGRAFEHVLIQEIRAYLAYRERDLPLSYWRTSTGQPALCTLFIFSGTSLAPVPGSGAGVGQSARQLPVGSIRQALLGDELGMRPLRLPVSHFRCAACAENTK